MEAVPAHAVRVKDEALKSFHTRTRVSAGLFEEHDVTGSELSQDFEDRAGVARSNQRFTRDEQFRAYAVLIQRVAKTYLDCQRAEPLGAASWDSSKPRRGRTAAAIHYAIDVQHAVEFAFKGRGDRAELIRLFVMASNGITALGPSEKALMWKLGPVLKRRGLNPSKYFSGSSRHVEHREVSSIPDTAYLATATAMAQEVE